MKKIFSFLAVALLALGFTACEDVPAPYGIEDEIVGDGSKTLPYVQSFEASFGAYKNYTISGEGRWITDHKAAVASGYNSADQTTTAGCYMLVSPDITLEGKENAHIVMEYTLRYLKTQDNQKVMITKTFDENNPGEGWEQIPATLEEVGSWEETRMMDINVPESYMGAKVRIALYYNTPSTKGSSWQIKNLSVLEGVAEGGEDKPEEGVKELPYAETFSTDFGAFKNYTTSGAGAWKVDFHTAKASGYDFEAKKNTAGVYYLVSPEISLAGQTEVHLSYEYILAYASRCPNGNKLFITDNFDAENAAQNWTELKVNHKESVKGADGKIDWKSFNLLDVQIPTEFLGKTVRVAFYHECTDEGSTTMEIRNFKIEVGKANVTPDVKPEGDVQQLPYGEKFFDSLGLFKNFTTSGAGEWKIDFKTAKAAGYDNQTKVTTDGTYYLVSPEISLANQTEVHLAYEYVFRYNVAQENQQVLISTSFNEAAPTEGWTLLNGEHTEGTDWTTFSKADVQIPAEYMGKTIRVAFRYNCENQKGSTWEVKNFSIAAGKIGEGGNEGGGTPDTGDATASNGDFETWVDGLPNNWQSACTASKANLFQSEDAHGGKFAVQVGGNDSQNMRLAYKELDLKAGHYTMTFFVKAVTAEGGSVVPGYVQVTDGSVGQYMYKKIDGSMAYEDNLSNTEWRQVEYAFDLSEDGTYCMVVMNGKRPGKDVLIDDFTLTDADGNAIIK